MKYYLVFAAMLFSMSLLSQKATLVGHVTYGENKEDAIMVNVFSGIQGTTTDFEGRYSLKLEPGEYTFQFSAIGMKSHEETITLHPDEHRELNVLLDEEVVMITSVEILSDIQGTISSSEIIYRGCCCCCCSYINECYTITEEAIPPLEPLPETEEETDNLWIDTKVEPELTVYPNPILAGNSCTLAVNEVPVQSWMIFSESGALIRQGTFSETQNRQELDTGTLESGIYLVNVVFEGDSVITSRLVVNQ